MKTSPLFCRALVVLTLLACIDLSATNSDKRPADSVASYVVIGAFSKQQNALNFVSHASSKLHLAVKVEMNASRNLYYVYSLSTQNKKEAFAEAKRLRQETELQDAWVYHGALGSNPVRATSLEVAPITEVKPAETAAPTAEPASTIVMEDSAPTEPTPAASSNVEVEPQPQNVAIEEIAPEPIIEEETGTGNPFYFKLTRLVDQKPVMGSIDVINPDKAAKTSTHESNKNVRVPVVENKSGKVTLVAQAFGYRKYQRDITFLSPEKDSAVTVDQTGRTIVPMELVRLKKGDFAIMYNVFFFRDAAIMRPESKFEVNALTEMMKENPKCVIRIHGHTNGNHAGKIIFRGDTPEYFSLTGSRDGFGSAKELSGARAEAIKEYLVSQGVEEKRLEVKAWGGKKSIHKKTSARAAENVRVEVEIVAD
jgi:outer membrane protein OmpA-like peptidoglycan-associated protein